MVLAPLDSFANRPLQTAWTAKFNRFYRAIFTALSRPIENERDKESQ